MITLELGETLADLEGILALQRINHATAVAPEQWAGQGFVTMQYTMAQLQAMCGSYRHVVAKRDGAVVGYALVMLKEHKEAFPFLRDMFESIETGSVRAKPLRDCAYVVMGQVCVAAEWRGQGLARRMYGKLKEQMSADFEFVLTEVSSKNVRSMRAHLDVGFRDIEMQTDVPSEWHVIAWDWT
ncbi:MAG: GNAT family N-acetyltransferase [Pseudomonadota bacterium]